MRPDIVCYCRNVSRFTIQQAIDKDARSIEDIRWTTDACKDNKCKTMHPEGKCCIDEVKDMIVATHGCVAGSCSCCN